MSRSVNKIILIGHVGKDPDVRFTTTGKKKATFSVATSEGKDRTLWHQVIAWEKLADIVEEYVRKGRQVYVEGRLDCQEWTPKGGKDKRKLWQVVANQLVLLGPKDRHENHEAQDDGHDTPADTAPVDDDSDVPF